MVSRVATMVLGLLAEGERHGYDLVREMDDRGMLRWTRTSKVAVYKALARLQEEGCLTSWTVREGNMPEKRVYAITATGEERLKDLVYGLCASREPLRLDISVGLAFVGHLQRGEARDALENRLRYVRGQLKRLGREKEMARGLCDDLSQEMMRHELAAYREEARWLNRVLEILGAAA